MFLICNLKSLQIIVLNSEQVKVIFEIRNGEHIPSTED